MEPLAVRDVASERLLAADRDRRGGCLDAARVDAAGAIAEHTTDLPGQRGGAPRRRASRAAPSVSSAEAAQPLFGARADAREQPDVERREERCLPPGGTTVIPPGLRRSLATFATTFELPTPSEHERLVGAADRRLDRLREARARAKSAASGVRSR